MSVGIPSAKTIKEAHWGERDDYEPAFGYPLGDWYRQFAWLPTQTLDRGRVWLRFIWKRRIAKKGYLLGGPDTWSQRVVRK